MRVTRGDGASLPCPNPACRPIDRWTRQASRQWRGGGDPRDDHYACGCGATVAVHLPTRPWPPLGA